jgi:hypothetical protein
VEDKNYPGMRRGDEAREMLKSVKDPTTNQLMNMINFEVLKRFFERKDLPVCDFDMLFFMEVIREFCSQHSTMRKILAGEDLRAWTDDGLQD